MLGVSTGTGGLLLSAVILMGVALALSVLKTDLLPTVIVLIVFAGMLTAVGWLSQWFLIITAIVICALLGTKLAKGVTA